LTDTNLPIVLRSNAGGGGIGGWSVMPLGQYANLDMYLSGVGCPSTGDCYAVGTFFPSGMPTGGTGFIFDLGQTVTAPPVPTGVSSLSGAACPTANDCYAAGLNGFNTGLILNASTVSSPPACSSTATGSVQAPVGYWMAGADGAVYSCGNAPFYGSLVTLGVTPTHPIVGMAACSAGGGYWLAASDGGVFAFGLSSLPGGGFYGSMGGQHLNQPIVGMAATPDCLGYWLVAADGGIFKFGDANFLGSTGCLTLNKPVVGMAATQNPTTIGVNTACDTAPLGPGGYWMDASDGGIFTFGNATFLGSTGCITLNKPVVGMAATEDPTTVGVNTACDTAPLGPGGYWTVAADGGVFSFGNAAFLGSTGCITLNKPVVGMAVSPDTATVGINTACDTAPLGPGGYWMVAGDGGIFSFGNAAFVGSLPGSGISVNNIVDMVLAS